MVTERADALVGAVAAWDLPSRWPFPSCPMDNDTFATVLSACEQHRLLGLLGGAVASGELPVTAPQHDRVDLEVIVRVAHKDHLFVYDAGDRALRHHQA